MEHKLEIHKDNTLKDAVSIAHKVREKFEFFPKELLQYLWLGLLVLTGLGNYSAV